MMNWIKVTLMAVLAGTLFAVAGCGKSKPENPKPAAEHTDGDGHDHSKH